MDQHNQFSLVSTIITALLLLTPFIFSTIAIDLESAKEQPCFPIKKLADVDENWLNSSEGTWYYPVMSRLDLYYTSLEIAHKEASELQENEVYYDSCIRFEMPNETMDSVGFGGQRVKSTITPRIGKDGEPIGCHFVTDTGRSATVYTTFTDNSTFIFAASCMDDNQMTWGVTSALKVLPKETLELIYDHAKSLGFKREYFTALRYDSCKIEDVDNTITGK